MDRNKYTVGFDKGYLDGKQNKPYKPPYHLGSDELDGYRDAYDLGEEDRDIEQGK